MKKICVIGLGYVGLPILLRLSRKYNCVGYDNNLERINDLKRQMRIYSTQGIINQIIDKNPSDDKIIKIMENVFQTRRITPVQEAYVRFSNN